MRHLRFTLPFLLMLLALLTPALATGLCGGLGQLHPLARVEASQTTRLPSPCDMQGGKRLAPAESPAWRHLCIELPRATEAQWRSGLADDPVRHGREPATDLPPPRLL